jgi:hypothetical protein
MLEEQLLQVEHTCKQVLIGPLGSAPLLARCECADYYNSPLLISTDVAGVLTLLAVMFLLNCARSLAVGSGIWRLLS